MSFDINPLGNTFHLQQLEREVSQIKAFERAAGDETDRAAAKPAHPKSWFGFAIRSLWSRATA